jgi:transglutaminase-like putative cysteine protease
MLQPSDFAKPSALLTELAAKLHVTRRGDPMTLLRQITRGIHEVFRYTPKSTRVDSPIDDALRTRQGVCQDFSHIMITLVRQLKVPCRYVSGYVVRGEHLATSSGSHAWVEALMPGWGWVGFDPTLNALAGERHVRCAVGRDYMDVPPTKGIYKGDSRGELNVQVQVIPTEAPSQAEVPDFAIPNSEDWLELPGEEPKPGPSMAGYRAAAQQQQQQQ